MPAIVQPKITDAGLAAAIDADNNGLELNITHIALGTGAYDSEAVGAGMTAMAGLKEFVAIGGGSVSGVGAVRMMALFEAWTGTPNPYNATELAFWAGAPGSLGAVMFAVFSSPTDVIVTRNALDFVSTFTLQLTRVPPGSVTVEIDPSAAHALELVHLHEQATDPHPQYVKKAGDTSTGAQFGLTASQHANDKAFATTEFAKRIGISYPANGGLGISTPTFNLTIAHMGRWVDLLSNGGTATLPLASGCPVGGSYSIRVPVAGATLLASGSDTIVTPSGEVLSGLQLSRGETLIITRNAENNWYVTSIGGRQPAGQLAFFAGNAAPSGWLKLNGAILSRTAYSALWAYAQSTGGVVSDSEWLLNYWGRFSSGTDGSNFRLPDARGMFIRAFDDGRGTDFGRAWGTYQESQNLSHTHTATMDAVGSHSHTGVTNVAGNHRHDSGWGESNAVNARYGTTDGVQNKYGTSGGFDFDNYANWTSTDGNHQHILSIDAAGQHFHNMSIQASGGAEARPKNLAMGLFIKF